jgi:hypothetical protein
LIDGIWLESYKTGEEEPVEMAGPQQKYEHLSELHYYCTMLQIQLFGNFMKLSAILSWY